MKPATFLLIKTAAHMNADKSLTSTGQEVLFVEVSVSLVLGKFLHKIK